MGLAATDARPLGSGRGLLCRGRSGEGLQRAGEAAPDRWLRARDAAREFAERNALKGVANGDNAKLERQLDETGRTGATAMGETIRALRIPIGVVLTSPTYRAMETVRPRPVNRTKNSEAENYDFAAKKSKYFTSSCSLRSKDPGQGLPLRCQTRQSVTIGNESRREL